MVAFGLILKAEETSKAIRTLVARKFAEDGLALIRVLVEKILNAAYILLHGPQAATDYIQFLAVMNWRDYQDLKKTMPELAASYYSAVRVALRALMRQSGTRSFQMVDGYAVMAARMTGMSRACFCVPSR